MKNRRIMVTGAAGFIGSNLVEFLLADNFVVGVDNFSNGREENLRDFYGNRNFKLERIDVKNKEALKRAMKDIDIVFHLSANSDVRKGYENPEVDFNENALATRVVLEAMRESDVGELVFSSTSTVYGNAELIPTPESYGPLKPISHYGASKLAAEAFIFSYSSNYGFKSSVFRFANVVGKRGTHGAIFDFIRKLKQNSEELEVLGDGTQTKSYIYVDDCISGMTYLHGKADGLFNLGTKGQTSVAEIAEMTVRKFSPGAKIKFVGGPGGAGWIGDVKKMSLDISKALNNGWRYRLDSTEAVRKAIEGAHL
ncbi:MAG: NAD-dependent epimerase/dehydratase family protein [Thermoplasmatales archaeon]